MLSEPAAERYGRRRVVVLGRGPLLDRPIDSTSYFIAFDPYGNAVAILKANQVFHLQDHNQLVGAGFVFSCDLAGENCVSVSPTPSKITGERMIVERGATAEKDCMRSPHHAVTLLGLARKRQQVGLRYPHPFGKRPGFSQLQPHPIHALSQDVGAYEILIGQRKQRNAK